MKKTRQLAVSVAAAITVAMFVSTSAFADSRHQNETWRDRDARGESREYRDNQRVTTEGRIRSLDRDRDGYRVQLDQGAHSFWVPEQSVRSRAREFRVGASIRFGGVFRGGSIYVDVVDWPNNGSYDDRYRNDGYRDDRYRDGNLRGVVERVDDRRGVLVVRDANSGRHVTVDIDRRGSRRDRGVDLEDLRRGDYVTLAGQWLRGNIFEAYRIESVRSGRGRR